MEVIQVQVGMEAIVMVVMAVVLEVLVLLEQLVCEVMAEMASDPY